MRISDLIERASSINNEEKQITIDVNGIAWVFPKGKYQAGGDIDKKTRKTKRPTRSKPHKEAARDSHQIGEAEE